jgi:alkylhydroperoxidase/carboxymuconolactone decarboxylase family protein YurZ
MKMTTESVNDKIKRIETDELHGELDEKIKKVGHIAPEMFDAYSTFRELLFADKKLSRKSKLLIAVGIMTVLRTHEALALYSRISLNAGASKEELLEAMSVGVLFSGGPGIVAMSNAIQDLGI